MKQKHYTRLSIENKEVISRGLSANLSYAEIARQIGRPTSTVSREVKNNYGRYAYRCCQLSGRLISLWAEGAAINVKSFKIKGLLVMSIVA